MSKIGLIVPLGFEILHLIGGISMTAGFVCGNLAAKGGKWIAALVVTALVFSVASAVAYFVMSVRADPGILGVLIFSILDVGIFFSSAFVLGIGERVIAGRTKS